MSKGFALKPLSLGYWVLKELLCFIKNDYNVFLLFTILVTWSPLSWKGGHENELLRFKVTQRVRRHQKSPWLGSWLVLSMFSLWPLSHDRSFWLYPTFCSHGVLLPSTPPLLLELLCFLVGGCRVFAIWIKIGHLIVHLFTSVARVYCV